MTGSDTEQETVRDEFVALNTQMKGWMRGSLGRNDVIRRVTKATKCNPRGNCAQQRIVQVVGGSVT